MPNNEPLKHHIHNIPIYVSSSIPLAKIAVLQDNKLLKRKGPNPYYNVFSTNYLTGNSMLEFSCWQEYVF